MPRGRFRALPSFVPVASEGCVVMSAPKPDPQAWFAEHDMTLRRRDVGVGVGLLLTGARYSLTGPSASSRLSPRLNLTEVSR